MGNISLDLLRVELQKPLFCAISSWGFSGACGKYFDGNIALKLQKVVILKSLMCSFCVMLKIKDFAKLLWAQNCIDLPVVNLQ